MLGNSAPKQATEVHMFLLKKKKGEENALKENGGGAGAVHVLW